MAAGLSTADRPRVPALASGRPPRAHASSPLPERALEAQADRAAALALSGSGTHAAGLLAFRSPPRLQRKCACGGTCEKCGEQQEDLRIQRMPEDAPPTPTTPPPAAAPAAAAATPAPDVQPVLVEDAQPPEANQMNRSVFLALLRSQLFAMCDIELAVAGRTSEGCPYLTHYMDQAQARSAAQLERSIRLYTGTTARSPQGLIEAVMSRVRAAVRIWVSTGQVSPPASLAGAAATVLDLGARAASAVGGLFTPSVQTKRADGAAAAVAASPAAVRSQLGPGRGLDSGVRSRMETGFGLSFAGVRIHTDNTAQRLAGGFSARAFTVGSDVAFNSGEYRPGTVEGDLLIAHELAHTVQQGGARHDDMQAGAGADLEDDADRAAVGAVGSHLGLAEQAEPRRRSGLRLQGCGQKVKRCPPHYSWRVNAVTGWGSFGCTCHWKCMPGDAPRSSSSSGPAVTCPPDMNCDTGVRYEDLGSDYTKKGYGAAMTPLGEQDFCGCFPLDVEGTKVSDVPLRPDDFQMADVIGPMAEMAAARRGSGRPQTDPRTGQRIPGQPDFEPGQPGRPRTAITGNLGADVESGMNRVGDIRTTYGVSRGKNIAFADYNIEGLPNNRRAAGSIVGISGRDTRGTPAPANPQYPSLIVGHDRSLDSEKKIVEHLTNVIGDNPNASGTVNIFTERNVCAGCDVVIAEFRRRYPRLTVNVVSGQR